jgi:hypothetical protein
MAGNADSRGRWVVNAALITGLVVLSLPLVLVLWPWINKLPPEVLGTMCGQSACLPLTPPVSAASSPAASPTRPRASAP